MARNARWVEDLRDTVSLVQQGRFDARLDRASPGSWGEASDLVNLLIETLVGPARDVTRVMRAVTRGDFEQRMPVASAGEPLVGELGASAAAVNDMVDGLVLFTTELHRVAEAVGARGELGKQARVPGPSGAWRAVTESVNAATSSLAAQIRDVAYVIDAVSAGDLSRRTTVEAHGDMLRLKTALDTMVEHLAHFTGGVTQIAHAVGTEGRLGGRADVAGMSGSWLRLTEGVNLMSVNLSSQFRTITEVVRAVSKGDLTRTIPIEFSGEVESLKLNINEMIRHLKDTTQENTEQVWLTTNLARMSHLLQGERDTAALARVLLAELCATVSAQQGVFYLAGEDGCSLNLLATHAAAQMGGSIGNLTLGDGLVAQCAFERSRMFIRAAPDHGRRGRKARSSSPATLLVFPVLFEGRLKAVIELASFGPFTLGQQMFLDQLAPSLGAILNTLAADMRTVALLNQSQTLTADLLRANKSIERANEELETFASAVAHDLRAPLRGITGFSTTLLEDHQAGLDDEGRDLLARIRASATRMSALIDDLLHLSHCSLDAMAREPVDLTELAAGCLARLAHEDPQRRVVVRVAPDLHCEGDSRLLRVAVENLLHNAWKFSANKPVAHIEVDRDAEGAYYVRDDGVGFDMAHAQSLFGAFQRLHRLDEFEGEGIGLITVKRVVERHGGTLTAVAAVNQGATFTFTLARSGGAARA